MLFCETFIRLNCSTNRIKIIEKIKTLCTHTRTGIGYSLRTKSIRTVFRFDVFVVALRTDTKTNVFAFFLVDGENAKNHPSITITHRESVNSISTHRTKMIYCALVCRCASVYVCLCVIQPLSMSIGFEELCVPFLCTSIAFVSVFYLAAVCSAFEREPFISVWFFFYFSPVCECINSGIVIRMNYKFAYGMYVKKENMCIIDEHFDIYRTDNRFLAWAKAKMRWIEAGKELTEQEEEEEEEKVVDSREPATSRNWWISVNRHIFNFSISPFKVYSMWLLCSGTLPVYLENRCTLIEIQLKQLHL